MEVYDGAQQAQQPGDMHVQAQFGEGALAVAGHAGTHSLADLPDWLARLPNDIKTRVIVTTADPIDLHPAICVNKACRDTLWADPRRLTIKVPVDVRQSHTNATVRGTLRAISKRAELRRQLEGSIARNSYGVKLEFSGWKSCRENIATAGVALVLNRIDTSDRAILTGLHISADIRPTRSLIPFLPNLTHLHLHMRIAQLTQEFFSKLDLPQLKDLYVHLPDGIPVWHAVPPGAHNLERLSVTSDGTECSLTDMPTLPKLTRLETDARITLSTLASLTSGPLPALRELIISEVVPGVHSAASVAGSRLGALRQVTVRGNSLSLSLAARLQSHYSVQTIIHRLGFKKPTVLLYLGDSREDLEPTEANVDAQISEFNSKIFPMITAGHIMWHNYTTVRFPRHLVSTMIHVLVRPGLLSYVQLTPTSEYDLCDGLRQLRLCTTSSAVDCIDIKTGLPKQRVTELVAQCWPELPRRKWSFIE